jgi:hypothetical protein
MQSMRRGVDLDDDSTIEDGAAHGGIGIHAHGISMKGGSHAHNRVHAVQRNEDFSLSKSPTIFSILSTSQHNPPLGLHTADTSASSSGSGSSPGHSILGSIAAGAETTNSKRRSLTSHKPPTVGSLEAAKQQQADSTTEDDLQFSISLTDEQDESGADESNKQDFLPIY